MDATEEAEGMPLATGDQQEQVQADFDDVPGDTEQSREEEEDNAEKPEEAKIEPPIEPMSQGELPAETQKSDQVDLIDLDTPRDQKPEEVLGGPAEPS